MPYPTARDAPASTNKPFSVGEAVKLPKAGGTLAASLQRTELRLSETANRTSETRSASNQIAGTAGPAGVGATSGSAISALSVISLRKNGINTRSATATAKLPSPSSVNSFEYSALVAAAVVPA